MTRSSGADSNFIVIELQAQQKVAKGERRAHTDNSFSHCKMIHSHCSKKKKKEKKNTNKKQVKSNLKLHQIEPWGHPVHWLPDFYDHTSIFLQEQDCDTHDILSPTLLFLTELCEQLSMSINIHPQNFKWLGSISMRRWTIFI